ncbi:hypothetical protein VTO42DRAFT_8030 [Malbranchea cinnamomea]
MEGEEDAYAASKRGRFRFKSKSTSRERGRNSSPSEDKSRSDHYRHRHHHHDHHHRRRRRHHKRKRSPVSRRDEDLHPPLSPNSAFRESLFDALADDEGAQYWEGVYGQPIHTYPRQGPLESMTDEEYAAYVRARMWEKTHQGLLEERERRRQAREKQEEERKRRQQAESDRVAFDRLVEESLRRGEERRSKKQQLNTWKEIWKRYLASWDNLNTLVREAASCSSTSDHSTTTPNDCTPRLRNLIVWPVESGKRRDITPQAVREFIQNSPSAISLSDSDQAKSSASSTPSDFLTTLKAERVRWHPDKIQHRYGMLGMEDQVMKSVTEVFQILDRMWVEEKAKS